MVGVNYFFGVRISHPNILGNIASFQQEYISENEELFKQLEEPNKSHITLNVLHLTEEQIDPCVKLIREKLNTTFTEEERTIKIQGVDKFGSKVVFAKPTEGVEFLGKLRTDLNTILMEGGFDVREVDRKYQPHVTMFKTRFRGSRSKKGGDNEYKKKQLGDDLNKYSDTLFGKEIMKEFQLLSMNKRASEDGYYHSEATFTF